MLDCGLAANDEYFWQEVHERYQVANENYDNLAFEDAMFDGNNSDTYYLYLWLQEKPDVSNVVAPYLPNEVFIDSNTLLNIPLRRLSPPNSNSMKQTLNDNIKMLVSARQPDPSQLKLTEAKSQAQVSKNKDDSFQRLLETERKL